MRPTARFTLHAILAAALMAFAATSAAAADPAYLKFGGVEGEGAAASGPGKGEWIEIQSYQWGPRQTTSADGSVAANSDLKYAPGGGKAQGQMGGVQVATGDLDGDGRADVVANSDVKSPRDAASGLPTGKRQHKPLMLKGSMSFRGQLTGCAVGTSYRQGTLATRQHKYELQDIVITSCATGGGGGGGSLPMEEISFNYSKINTAPVPAEEQKSDKWKPTGWDLGKAKGN